MFLSTGIPKARFTRDVRIYFDIEVRREIPTESHFAATIFDVFKNGGFVVIAVLHTTFGRALKTHFIVFIMNVIIIMSII